MNLLVYINIEDAQAQLDLIEAAVVDLHEPGTTKYTNIISHPTESKHAIVLPFGDDIYDETVVALLAGHTVEDFTEDWKLIDNTI